MSFTLLGILNSQAAGGGAAEAYELISTQTAVGNVSSISFGSIPQDYKHLQIRVSIRSTRNSGDDPLIINFNGSSTGYSYGNLYNLGSVNGTEQINRAYFAIPYIPSAQAPNTIFTPLVLDIADYSKTNKFTTVLAKLGWVTGNNYKAFNFEGGQWDNTNALTSINFDFSLTGSNIQGGSVISIYGVRG